MVLFREYLVNVLMPLLLASVGGAVLGWEREARDKPAGLRTHMLVSLAAAAFMAAVLEYIDEHAHTELAFLRIDPSHVMGGIVGGVGFLGAGTIIEARHKVYGITTAASIWAAAAIGTACGMRLYAIAITSVLLAVFILLLLGLAERHLLKPNTSDDAPG